MVTRRLFVAAAVVAIAGCSLDKQGAPPLSGPSELGLSINVTATPDIITQDGQSQSTIEIFARDPNSQPVRGVTLRVQTIVNGRAVDFGELSTKVTSTNSEGKAFIFYRAPAAPPPTVSTDSLVSIDVTPVGTNYAGAVGRSVDIRLARPGVLNDPGAAPTARFIFSPTTPRFEDDIFFDASSSTGKIVSYHWNWGDGDTSNAGPTAQHHYDMPGTYNVVLTVVDTLGRAAASAPTPVVVGSFAAPTAAFTFSPSPVKVGAVVNFNASLSKADVGRTIVQYQWDFGDGSGLHQGPGPTTTKAYPAVGSYTVVLKITDSGGATATSTQTISVVP